MLGSSPPLKVAIAGGSIAGLCAGIALRGIGCEVDVYERTPGAMTSRGAGIVVQGDLVRLLRRQGSPQLPAASCRQRRYLLPDGGEGGASLMPQRFTSWDAIYRTLRAMFPGERYHPGSTLTGFAPGGRAGHRPLRRAGRGRGGPAGVRGWLPVGGAPPAAAGGRTDLRRLRRLARHPRGGARVPPSWSASSTGRSRSARRAPADTSSAISSQVPVPRPSPGDAGSTGSGTSPRPKGPSSIDS